MRPVPPLRASLLLMLTLVLRSRGMRFRRRSRRRSLRPRHSRRAMRFRRRPWRYSLRSGLRRRTRGGPRFGRRGPCLLRPCRRSRPVYHRARLWFRRPLHFPLGFLISPNFGRRRSARSLLLPYALVRHRRPLSFLGPRIRSRRLPRRNLIPSFDRPRFCCHRRPPSVFRSKLRTICGGFALPLHLSRHSLHAPLS